MLVCCVLVCVVCVCVCGVGVGVCVCLQFSFSYVGEKTGIPLPKENGVFEVRVVKELI